MLYAVFHLTGRTRAFLLQLEALEKEFRLVENDSRAGVLLDAIRQTKDPELGLGTVGHLEVEATKLLRSLTEGELK
ncbi:MAG: hypothetical protein ACREN8_07555 [Candidatus Dormibacteraceae bacterium]